MRLILSFLLIFGLTLTVNAQQKPAISKNKKAVISAIDGRYDELTTLSDKIWSYAEEAFRETKSSEALIQYAEANGFKVKKGVAEIPTAFVAEYGSGKPIIGILGEFDALPGLSQKAVPTKDPLQEGAPGHGCGHNLFGTASLGAATAIKELIEKGELQGTVRFYGTPAEEGGGGKVYMVRAGLFDDVDAMLHWHPGDQNSVSFGSTLSNVSGKFRFYGQASHAAGAPHRGRSAHSRLRNGPRPRGDNPAG